MKPARQPWLSDSIMGIRGNPIAKFGSVSCQYTPAGEHGASIQAACCWGSSVTAHSQLGREMDADLKKDLVVVMIGKA